MEKKSFGHFLAKWSDLWKVTESLQTSVTWFCKMGASTHLTGLLRIEEMQVKYRI